MKLGYQHLRLRVSALIMTWSLCVWLVCTGLLDMKVVVPSWPSWPSGDSIDRGQFDMSQFPSPMDREGEDWLDSIDPRRRPFSPHGPPREPFPELRPTRFLPDHCLEAWFLEGESSCGKAELGPEDTLDAVWLWVNGSDSRWANEQRYYRRTMGVKSPLRHFREQNELVYSMRSVLENLRGHLRTVHLILYDFAFNATMGDVDLVPQSTIEALEEAIGTTTGSIDGSKIRGEETKHPLVRKLSTHVLDHLNARWRVVQTPTWLDFSRRDSRDPQHPVHPASGSEISVQHSHLQIPYPILRYAGHSEIFHLPTTTNQHHVRPGEKHWREEEWRRKSLPTYNSMSIESRIGWLPGLADVAIALNDDFFMMRPHAVSDFHSPFYGNVIRFKTLPFQWIKADLDDNYIHDAGEMGGLYHANWLLSQRFPKRKRPYFAHAPKVITRGLHQEASLMFEEALTQSSSRRFRELRVGNGDVQIQWLLTQLRVERWREALLWTYVVANLGISGVWNATSRQIFLGQLNASDSDRRAEVSTVDVRRGHRDTLAKGRMEMTFDRAGWEKPKRTTFDFTCLDGHFPPLLPEGADVSEKDRCVLDLELCFGSPFWTGGQDILASELFKRLTFQYPECGDCLIMALVTASGRLGLSAFFPPASVTYMNPSTLSSAADHGSLSESALPPPHLPLDSTWQTADFALDSVLSATSRANRVIDLRLFCMKLLSRYLYSSGNSDVHFHRLENAEGVEKSLKQLDDSGSVAILGLNDDIERDYERIRALLSGWFNRRWPQPAMWERTWKPHGGR